MIVVVSIVTTVIFVILVIFVKLNIFWIPVWTAVLRPLGRLFISSGCSMAHRSSSLSLSSLSSSSSSSSSSPSSLFLYLIVINVIIMILIMICFFSPQVTDIDMLRYYSSRGQKGQSRASNFGRKGGRVSNLGEPERLAQSVVLGLQFWVGAKHFREGRMEVRPENVKLRGNKLWFPGLLLRLPAPHLQQHLPDPRGRQVHRHSHQVSVFLWSQIKVTSVFTFF